MKLQEIDTDQLSVNRLATMTGLDRRTVGRYLEGVAPSDESGRSPVYRLRDLVGKIMEAKAAPADGADYSRLPPKDRKDAAMADKYELENRVRRGELAELQEVEEAWTTLVLSARNRLIAMPKRLAQRLAKENRVAEVEKAIGAVVDEILKELSGE